MQTKAALVGWNGERQFELTLGIDVDTPVRIGSTTKPMTTAAILAAVGDRLDEVLPHGMTLRQLLSQTGGMAADPITPDNLYGPTDPGALQRWAASIRPSGGTDWCYSNPSIALAGAYAEMWTGTPITELVELHVWEPLGMTNTSWCRDNAIYACAGFARSSAADLAKFLPRVPEAMKVRHADTVGQDVDGYGLGLYVGADRYGHVGGIADSGCQFQATLDGRTGVAFVYEGPEPEFTAYLLDLAKGNEDGHPNRTHGADLAGLFAGGSVG